MEKEYCRHCSYHRYTSIKYGVDYSFCVKYLQPIEEILVCNKKNKPSVNVKKGYEKDKSEHRTIADRLNDGYKMLSDDEIVD